MHPNCPGVALAAGVLVVSQPPCGYENGSADAFDQRPLPAREVPGQHLAPPVVGHIVNLAQQVERKGGTGHVEAASFQDVLHFARGEYLNMPDVVALPAVDWQFLAVPQTGEYGAPVALTGHETVEHPARL